MNILAQKVLNICLILADFEIFWVCVGRSVSFVLRFWKTMELRITSTTLHPQWFWPRTRACRPCDEGWCPWKRQNFVVNFLVNLVLRDWIHWRFWSSFLLVILKNLLAHQGTSGRATDFLQRPNFHRPRRTHLAWCLCLALLELGFQVQQVSWIPRALQKFSLNIRRRNTFLCKAASWPLDKQFWLPWFATVVNRKSFWVHKCSQYFTTRTQLHFGLSSRFQTLKNLMKHVKHCETLNLCKLRHPKFKERHDPHRSIRSGQQKLLVLAKGRYRNDKMSLTQITVRFLEEANALQMEDLISWLSLLTAMIHVPAQNDFLEMLRK